MPTGSRGEGDDGTYAHVSTRGVGVHREKLASFEQALRSAGVAYCNLVSVSSILPPNCKIIPRSAAKNS